MQILKAQAGSWARGKQLLYMLFQGSTTQWFVQMVGSRVEVERGAVLDRRMKFDRSNVEPSIHPSKE